MVVNELVLIMGTLLRRICFFSMNVWRSLFSFADMDRLKWSWIRVKEFIFFGNYFYALCVISLSIEASLQQSVGLNHFSFYLFLSSSTILYYTYAYMGKIDFLAIFRRPVVKPELPSSYNFYNQRTRWYHRNRRLLSITQFVFSLIAAGSCIYLAFVQFHRILSLHLSEWIALLSVPAIALLYYGNSFFPIFRINLRKTGWLKPFIVGFVWAGAVTLYPPMFHQWENNLHYHFDFLTFWFLIKNGMYITTLAIMFDIKDYADDANRNLKTFVVNAGLRKTIFFILLPLTLIGLAAFTIFAVQIDMSYPRYFFNLIPFVLLLMVAYSMHRRKAILYYLINIDGLMFVKGICGIIGVLWL